MTTELASIESDVLPWTDFDRAFESLRHGFFEPFGNFAPERSLRAAPADVEETPSAYKLTEFTNATASKDANYVRRERTYSGYYRSLVFPEPIVADKSVAKVENGVLTLELPKQSPQPVPTEVKVPVQ
ncbi:MAG: Hsp20 family protein [Thermoplasmatales archaeon]|nr:Hsp20 family protein [Thermoplasmatales archaeon]